MGVESFCFPLCDICHFLCLTALCYPISSEFREITAVLPIQFSQAYKMTQLDLFLTTNGRRGWHWRMRGWDTAVFDAYGWPHDLTDEQILERLLALNLERAGEKVGPLG